MASRVVPGWALTTSRRSPRMELISEDLPTLGRPTTASPMTVPLPFGRLTFGRRGQGRHQVVQEIVHAVAVLGGDRVQGLEPQAVEIGQPPFLLGAVDLVDGHHAPAWGSRAAGRACRGRTAKARFSRPARAPGDRPLRPPAGSGTGFPRKRPRRRRTRRCRPPERDIVPAGTAVMPVARHAGMVVHQRIPGARDAVEQGRFAHVGASEDGDDRGHVKSWMEVENQHHSFIA